MDRDQDYLALLTGENFVFNVSFGTTVKVGADDFRHNAYIHEDCGCSVGYNLTVKSGN
ncbi:hypothetical protein RG963_08950 [Methanosarcina sp. Z-7115]|uniref:Uncharacterized protein n=1 Tax=Methanosarcina baikalica TaxID=3073890 RepID=A0ABU2D1N1_9EURY|nr:hypothetical protein [Methanosarcina sp. Z-7115]MDR7665896.1 hypothetical protein [Methanosarcina sp. Z-7115]